MNQNGKKNSYQKIAGMFTCYYQLPKIIVKISIHTCYLNENTFQKRSSIEEGGGKSEGISGSYFRYFGMGVAFIIFVKIMRKHPTIYQCVVKFKIFTWDFSGSKLT